MKNHLRNVYAVAWLLAGLGCSTRASEEVPVAPPGEAWLTPEQLQSSNIAVRPVGEQTVRSAVTAGGRVTFDDLRVTHVFSPVTGRVTQIHAQPGEWVKQGAPLVSIASPDVGSTFSDLVKAQADLQAAEHEFKRQKELFEAHAGPQRDFEAAEDNFRKARAELDRASQKAKLLRTDSVNRVTQEYTLRAAIDGEVITRNVNLGMEVQGQYSGGNAVELFTVGSLDVVWVLADLFEMDLPRVQKGATVTVKVVAYPDKVFTGQVDWVSAALDPVSRTAKVRCAIPNEGRELKPEMYATVTVAAQGQRALAVPRGAVLRLGDQTVVFVQTGDAPGGRVKFERRPVVIDEEEAGEFVEISHGLEPGERIATSGAILLAGMI